MTLNYGEYVTAEVKGHRSGEFCKLTVYVRIDLKVLLQSYNRVCIGLYSLEEVVGVNGSTLVSECKVVSKTVCRSLTCKGYADITVGKVIAVGKGLVVNVGYAVRTVACFGNEYVSALCNDDTAADKSLGCIKSCALTHNDAAGLNSIELSLCVIAVCVGYVSRVYGGIDVTVDVTVIEVELGIFVSILYNMSNVIGVGDKLTAGKGVYALRGRAIC